MHNSHVKDSIKLLEGRNLDLYNIIFETVTNNQEAVQETARKCKKLFKKKDNPANPREVLTELEKVLRARQDGQTLAKHIDPSKQKNGPKTPDELKESLKKQREDYEYYIQHFLPALKAEITQSKKLEKEKAKEIGGIISGIISKSKDESRSSVETAEQSITSGSDSDSGRSSLTLVTSTSSEESVNSTSSSAGEAISSFKKQKSVRKKKHSAEVLGNAKPLDNTNTPKISGDSDSGLETSKESLKSPVSSSPISVTSTSSQEGLNSTSSSAGENNNPQKDPTQLKGKEKEAASSKQEVSKDILSKKQPNNRNLHVALVAGCALSTIGCIVAGAMTSGLVGAGLLAMAAVFAIAAVAELHSNFLSSKLTSISVEPHVNDKELTACSHL